MAPLHDYDPLGRFSGLAERYARARPSYPSAAIDYLVTTCALGPTSLLVDVGCGTGISSRLFAGRGIPVVGIEPNADMRAQAAAAALTEGQPRPRYQDGQAEATGLPDGVADTVLAAQAFHWFRATAALQEFHRLLRPGGWVALMWNEREESDPFTAAYGDVIRTAPQTQLVEGNRGQAGAVLLECPLFQEARRVAFANEQPLDEDGMIERALSASYAPKEPEAVKRFTAALRGVYARYQRQGCVVLRYETSIYCARKPR